MKVLTTIVKPLVVLSLFLGSMSVSLAQFADCSTGLLQMPTAEMQEDGTVLITNNFLNKHSLASTVWDYNTFQYGVAVSFWGRLEIGYVCTLFNGAWSPNPNKSYRESIIRNQDRHFTGRVCLLREGEFNLSWMPAVVVGMIDPTTGSGDGEYFSLIDVTGAGNGYFNRSFVVMSKHFQTAWGLVGAHAGYQINFRSDYAINGPCLGVNWCPVWLHQRGVLDDFNLIAEYDSRTVNIGFVASILDNHFEAMFELQNFKWVNFGLRYKIRLRNNK